MPPMDQNCDVMVSCGSLVVSLTVIEAKGQRWMLLWLGLQWSPIDTIGLGLLGLNLSVKDASGMRKTGLEAKGSLCL